MSNAWKVAILEFVFMTATSAAAVALVTHTTRPSDAAAVLWAIQQHVDPAKIVANTEFKDTPVTAQQCVNIDRTTLTVLAGEPPAFEITDALVLAGNCHAKAGLSTTAYAEYNAAAIPPREMPYPLSVTGSVAVQLVIFANQAAINHNPTVAKQLITQAMLLDKSRVSAMLHSIRNETGPRPMFPGLRHLT